MFEFELETESLDEIESFSSSHDIGTAGVLQLELPEEKQQSTGRKQSSNDRRLRMPQMSKACHVNEEDSDEDELLSVYSNQDDASKARYPYLGRRSAAESVDSVATGKIRVEIAKSKRELVALEERKETEENHTPIEVILLDDSETSSTASSAASVWSDEDASKENEKPKCENSKLLSSNSKRRKTEEEGDYANHISKTKLIFDSDVTNVSQVSATQSLPHSTLRSSTQFSDEEEEFIFQRSIRIGPSAQADIPPLVTQQDEATQHEELVCVPTLVDCWQLKRGDFIQVQFARGVFSLCRVVDMIPGVNVSVIPFDCCWPDVATEDAVFPFKFTFVINNVKKQIDFYPRIELDSYSDASFPLLKRWTAKNNFCFAKALRLHYGNRDGVFPQEKDESAHVFHAMALIISNMDDGLACFAHHLPTNDCKVEQLALVLSAFYFQRVGLTGATRAPGCVCSYECDSRRSLLKCSGNCECVVCETCFVKRVLKSSKRRKKLVFCLDEGEEEKHSARLGLWFCHACCVEFDE